MAGLAHRGRLTPWHAICLYTRCSKKNGVADGDAPRDWRSNAPRRQGEMTVVPMRRTGEGRSRSIAVIAVAILMVLGFGFGAVQAQDTAVGVTHPAHLHQGTC